ncbi:GNAT N-acetyltransferase [Paracoccus aurantiacus]|uniref:GNAT N-acetyltransferase n=1 Tax=Paracoccus aurantiacus TaxID=2599412 RepID=A0A5C6SAH9_9RHOB|nr:GNAT family N-acetyltransferase [Paracoccus aurantiacus]TXB71022.1 GNAT N-acetyltransferase [Paracoccus aurantiacus]
MRVRLRAPQPGDRHAIVAALQDRDTVSWLSRVPWPYHLADADHFLDEVATDKDQAILVDGHFAGMIRLHGELGYWIAPDYRKRGVATRSAQMALFRAFSDGKSTVTATSFVGNSASLGVLHRVGFVETGRQMATRRMDGEELEQIVLKASPESFAAALHISTRRCRLDRMTEADLTTMHRIATMPQVARMLLRFHPDQTPDQVAEVIRPAMDPLDRPVRLAIRLNGQCIGSVGVAGGDEPSVFYFLDPAMAGKGLASEIVPEFCDAVQDWYGLDTLRAEVFQDNPASRRVLEKAGFAVIADIAMPSAGRAAPEPGWIMQRG